MILDQEAARSKRTSVSFATIIELLLVVAVISSLLLRDGLSDIRLQPFCLKTSLALAIWYLFAYYWMSKPRVRSFRTVVLSIVYGVVFALLTMTFVALANFVTWTTEYTLLSTIVVGVVVAVDLGLGLRSFPVAGNATFIRLGIFVSLIAIFHLIPIDERIHLTFRKYPAFLKVYEQNQGEMPFDELYATYTKFFPLVREP